MKYAGKEIEMCKYLDIEVQRNEEMWGKNSIDAQKARERRDKALREMKGAK